MILFKLQKESIKKTLSENRHYKKYNAQLKKIDEVGVDLEDCASVLNFQHSEQNKLGQGVDKIVFELDEYSVQKFSQKESNEYNHLVQEKYLDIVPKVFDKKSCWWISERAIPYRQLKNRDIFFPFVSDLQIQELAKESAWNYDTVFTRIQESIYNFKYGQLPEEEEILNILQNKYKESYKFFVRLSEMSNDQNINLDDLGFDNVGISTRDKRVLIIDF